MYWTLAIVKIYKIADPRRADVGGISGWQHLQRRCWMVLARCYPTVWNLRHLERPMWLHPELRFRPNAKEEKRRSVRLLCWRKALHAEESMAEHIEERTAE